MKSLSKTNNRACFYNNSLFDLSSNQIRLNHRQRSNIQVKDAHIPTYSFKHSKSNPLFKDS